MTVQTAQRNSLKLLQWMMAASLALPMALFAFAAAVAYVASNETADRQIERIAVPVEHGGFSGLQMLHGMGFIL